MKIEIAQDKANPLLNRRELDVVISYESGTPKREEVREELSKMLGAEKERIIIEKMESIFGSNKARAHVHVYDTAEHAKRYERRHILRRHGMLEEEVKQTG
ncbi:MAG TPA: 30S ribosomal protein S24e [Nitrososphaeria archaeon]|nr:30S ribosomal protein S24e [Nitrososphaeria archaeon]